MMLGELDFVGTYVNPYYQNQLKLAVPSFLILSKIIKCKKKYIYL